MPSTDERLDITVITHARDEAVGLRRLIPSVAWAREVIVVDMQSRDDTAAVARAAGARVVSAPLHPRVDAIRNEYLALATTAWILVLDGDEWLPDDARERMDDLLQRYGASFDAFALPRFNTIAGHIMRGSSWYPDHQVRLFRRGCVRWPDATHRAPEILTGAGRLLTLDPSSELHIHHDNYADLREFIEKQVRYALSDKYDPASFDPESYAAAAVEAFARRHDPASDGDLSRALALVMAWDQVIRGLIHWDQADPRPSLEGYMTLPIAVTDRDLVKEVDDLRAALADRDRTIEALRNTRVLRLCRWFDAIRAGIRRG